MNMNPEQAHPWPVNFTEHKTQNSLLTRSAEHAAKHSTYTDQKNDDDDDIDCSADENVESNKYECGIGPSLANPFLHGKQTMNGISGK